MNAIYTVLPKNVESKSPKIYAKMEILKFADPKFPNSSIICLAPVLWNAQTSSPVGTIWDGGSKKPESPVSLNSIPREYGILATPKVQSIVPPEAT